MLLCLRRCPEFGRWRCGSLHLLFAALQAIEKIAPGLGDRPAIGVTGGQLFAEDVEHTRTDGSTRILASHSRVESIAKSVLSEA
jgi:hypothetical protein